MKRYIFIFSIFIFTLFPFTRINATNYAVIVGISLYSNNDQLAYCEYDAYDLKDTLVAYNWSSQNVVRLTDLNATYSAIRDSLTVMRTKVSSDDIFLLYYSGLTDESYNVRAYDNTITDDSLYTWLNNFNTDKIIVIIDADNSYDVLLNMGLSKGVSVYSNYGAVTNQRPPGLYNGLCTFYLVEGMNGWANPYGSQISIEEVVDYAEPYVYNFGGNHQTMGKSSGNLNFIDRGITTSGTLSSNETWKGVVYLAGDVIVPSGKTLTINAGTPVDLKGHNLINNGGTITSNGNILNVKVEISNGGGYYTSLNTALTYAGSGKTITAKSPYTHTLTSNATVNSGRTLVIQSGATIDLNGYDLINSGGTITNNGTINPIIKRSGTTSNYYGKISSAFSASGSGETINIQSGTCDNETGSITVPSGKTLELDAGVTIKMAKGNNQISVSGTLTAEGTSGYGNSITFTSAEASPAIGDWDGIRIQSGAVYLDLSYCTIEYAKCGIKSIDCDYNIYIDNSEIADCDTGFYLYNSGARIYKSEIEGAYDAFRLKNNSFLYLSDFDDGRGYNKIHFSMYLDYHCDGEWGDMYSGYNSFYGGSGTLSLKDTSNVHAEYNFWYNINTSVDGSSYLDRDPQLEQDPNKVPAIDIVDWEIEQLFSEARGVSLKNPEKAWDMFKDIIEKYPESKFAFYSLSRMKVISKKIQNKDFVSYLKYIINNKPSLKKIALEMSVNQLIGKGMIQDALTNCFYLLANYPDNKVKNYVLYELFRIYLDYLGDSSNADRVLADLKKVDTKNEVLPFTFAILDNFKNGNLDRKIGNLTFSYPNYPADIEGYKVKESEKTTTNIPKTFALYQNYPNPFNPITTIKFALPEISNVKIKVYNILGQEIETLINENLNAGFHEIKWNASRFASGVYICKLETGNYTKAIKIMLLK